MSGATHSETMRSNCGTWRLPQENESFPVAFHPIPVPRQSKFRDLNAETQQYRPDYPTQSYLENRFPVPTTPPFTPTHKHCIISAYGSQANPTSTHAGSSQYVSPWRSVARWATNGAALKWINRYGNDAEAHAAAIRLHALQIKEEGLISPPIESRIKHLYDHFPMNSSFSATVYLSKMEQEHGQIVFTQTHPGRIADPFPSSNVALPSPNLSHSYDISANPQWSPLSSSDSLPPPPPMFPRPSNISENPEWSSSRLVLPPLREMVPLPTYQVSVTLNSGDNVDDAQAISDPESAFGANVAALQPVRDPKKDAIDIPLVPVSRQESSPTQESHNAIVPTPYTQITFVSCPISSPRKKMNDISDPS